MTTLRDLPFRSVYFVPQHPFVAEALMPAMRCATRLSAMFGYFGAAALRDLAPGLADLLVAADAPLRLIISPNLSHEDVRALEEAEGLGEGLVEQRLMESLGSTVITEDALAQHTLQCLVFLLANGKLEIKVAYQADGLFHPKVWILSDPHANKVVLHGSSNLTAPGLSRNFEQVSVDGNWDAGGADRVHDFEVMFEQVWSNTAPGTVCVPLPTAVRHKLLETRSSGERPSREDYERAAATVQRSADPDAQAGFRLPAGLDCWRGAYAHQGDAIQAFEAANRRGILEMATGAGKTITALVAAHRMYEVEGRLLVVIAAPTRPLVAQWKGEVARFGLGAVQLPAARGAKLRRVRDVLRRLAAGVDTVTCLVLTNDALCDPGLQSVLADYRGPSLLIADEAHNLGAAGFQANTPHFFRARLGLSATPVRQYDVDGTEFLLTYFGPVVYQFGLDRAIGVCLVPYDYYVHPVQLQDDEMDEYQHLTTRIARLRARSGKDDDAQAALESLYRKRRAVLENARNKLAMLREVLDALQDEELCHSLVYASATAPAQLEEVNALLRQRGIRFHQLTQRETSDATLTADVLTAFRSGSLSTLTAKKVLDEGLNVPEIRTAFILASTTVERQWVQRRGRVLRTAPGKTHATLHDFVAVPPDGTPDDSTRALLRGELTRVDEFARLARNAGAPDGPLAVTHRLFMSFFGGS